MAVKILDKVDAVLLDVEGTTTPVDFVHKVLFRYAIDHITEFIRENWHCDSVKKALAGLNTVNNISSFKKQGNYNDADLEESIENYSDIIKKMINSDSKDGSLKVIEGMIWENGYRKGELRGEVYQDVPETMKKWRDLGKHIFIYSSGSVLAQRMLFETTNFGDLTVYIEGYFDTEIGGKKEPGSYIRISSVLQYNVGRIAFLSDSLQELDAASSAGFKTVLVQRNMVNEINGRPAVCDFKEIA